MAISHDFLIIILEVTSFVKTGHGIRHLTSGIQIKATFPLRWLFLFFFSCPFFFFLNGSKWELFDLKFSYSDVGIPMNCTAQLLPTTYKKRGNFNQFTIFPQGFFPSSFQKTKLPILKVKCYSREIMEFSFSFVDQSIFYFRDQFQKSNFLHQKSCFEQKKYKNMELTSIIQGRQVLKELWQYHQSWAYLEKMPGNLV